jgi:demethylmenaquinone methyltransferase / 2-methoxy-6-polyprenyl-1,4-benzoquinol methylase
MDAAVATPSTPAVLPPHPAMDRFYQGSKRPFLRQIFDDGAADYDRIERLMAMGSGSWYRRNALRRAGLARGMKVLDVAIGTGLVAREEISMVGDSRLVFGVDPSAGMLAQAKKSLSLPVIMGLGEQLPVADATFDFLSMGYALRHVSDLHIVFAEFYRVLKPGGRLCVLELTRPRSRFKMMMLRAYMRWLVPALTRLMTRGHDSQLLWQYYWETIELCVPPPQVNDALNAAGFSVVKHYTELGIFSEFTAIKPA